MKTRAQQFDRSARLALVCALLAFLTLQLGLAVAIERWLPELRDPEYAYRARRLQRRALNTAERPLTVVMLGSSRTTLGFKAAQVERPLSEALHQPVIAFNLGFTGAGPLMQLIDLRRLLTLGVQPDLLLIEVLPPLLAGQTGEHELYRLPLNRTWLGELGILKRYGRQSFEMYAAWWNDWPIPWYSHRYAIVSRFLPACLPYQRRMDWAFVTDDSGWAAAPVNQLSPAQQRQAVENARHEYSVYLDAFRIGGPACQALHELLDLCRQRQIGVALVLMPEGSEFRSLYSPAAWQQIDTFLAETSHKFGVPLVNAREWIADDNFTDSHHLLLRGATVFTERLGREVILPLLEGQANARLLAGRN
jgi:hypothetical protein